MSSKSIEDFLGVKWYDGLLVKSDHLMHSDNRVLSLLSDTCSMTVEQPGIVDIDAQTSAAAQLVEIGNLLRKEDGEGVEVAFNIMNPFRSITPAGSIVVAIPNSRSYHGAPTAEVKGEIKSSSRELATYLVCIRQEAKDEICVKRMYTPDQPIELEYPGLQVEIVKEDRYKNHLSSDYQYSTPVASISVEGDKAEVNTSYIPPVVRLEHVAHFDTGLVSSLASLFEELSDVSSQYLAAGGYVFSREGIGAELRTRYNYYHVLNAMLLGKSGLFRSLPKLSPLRFFYELLYPLTRWFDRYYESLGERQSSIAPVSAASSKIRDLSYEDLCASTDKLLSLSREFIYRINETIKVIA